LTVVLPLVHRIDERLSTFFVEKEFIMETRRNSPCTCGSGKKYKQCCGQLEAKRSRNFVVVVVVLIIGMVLAGAVFVSKNESQQPATAGAPVDAGAVPAAQSVPQAEGVPGSPQPPGPAPAGKVWSTEHGHWHDAAPAGAAPGAAAQPGQAQPAQAQQAFKPGPQPPGPVPPGKVWSAEHGHWHDAPK
jgi:hypothetical protein